jgi:ribosome-associated toxin RatA of RatAB toxin-antitoxin module
MSPLIHIESDAHGWPKSATASGVIRVPPSRLWEAISDVEGYANRVPMLDKVTREGDRVTVRLRFRITLFSVHFQFVADARYEEGRWLELAYVSGEPSALKLRFELEEDPQGTLLHASIAFDVDSLGWLVKYFLKHHPEIKFGIFPGSALALHESMRRAIE